jgi:hypothetical protein
MNWSIFAQTKGQQAPASGTRQASRVVPVQTALKIVKSRKGGMVSHKI